MKKSHQCYMATANIIPIIEDHNSDQPAVIYPIGDSDQLTTTTLLPDGQDIETLNSQDTWKDPETGKVWILPKSKEFPDYINKMFGNEQYMSTKENFLNQIVKVLKTNKQSSEESESDGPSPLFPYQRFVRDYLRIGTPYRSLLLEHGLGSGKTRSTIEVAKTFRKAGLKTLILTPAFLRLNFMEELNRWEDPGVDIKTWYKFAHYNATGYSPGTKSAGRDIGGKGGVFDQLASLGIGFSRSDPKYGKTFPYLYEKYKHDIKPPEHMLIIIEEAHNLNRSFINAGSSRVKSLLYPLLMQAKDCKFILLSGTPIVSSPFELAPMYNILRGPLKDGHSAFPTDENVFNSHFVDYVTRSFNNKDIMMSRMVGLNSYFIGITDDEERAIFPARKDHIYNLTTMPYQTWKHDLDLDEELGSKISSKKEKLMALPGFSQSGVSTSKAQEELTPKGSYHTRSRAACNFVFPQYVSRPRKGKKDFELLHKYLFQFKRPDGKPAKSVEDYQKVFDQLLEVVDLAEEEDEYMEQWSALVEAEDVKDIRGFLSELFMWHESILKENDGFPMSNPFYKCLSKTDIETIDRAVGKYADRIKLALRDLAVPPPGKPSAFTLKALKHYSIKMYAIYKIIAGDKEAGAPHLIDDPDYPTRIEDNMFDDDGDIDLGSESEIEEMEESNDDMEQTMETEVQKVVDPDDPLQRDEFANVYRSDKWLDKYDKKVVGGPALVYSYFSSAEGAAIFSMILQAHGFENFNSSTTGPKELSRAKRFAFFRGGMDQAMKRNILRVFNSKENVNGQLIRVIFVTQAAAEGISLFNLRQIHIMEPHWDNVMIEQVIGRGFRLMAHRNIENPDEREINVYRYFCVRPEKHVMDKWASKHGMGEDYYAYFNNITHQAKMADHMIQAIADEKDKFRLKLNDIRTKVAVDCYLNYKYNKPKDGCFSYHDKKGPAFSTSIKSDISNTREVKVKTKSERISFVQIKSKGVVKVYIIYPDRKPVKLRFEKTGDKLFEAIELYGPINGIPTDTQNYIVPESALHAGYFHRMSNKFIPIGAGTPVS